VNFRSRTMLSHHPLPLLVARVAFALIALNLTASCQTTRLNPAEGPSDAESATALARARATTAPTISVRASASQINEGGSATLTFTTSKPSPGNDLTVNCAMTGTAVLGTHYTLSGSANSIVIPAGASSASLTLNALTTGLSSGSEVATMNLRSGAGYKLPKAAKASVTIMNTSAAPSPTPTPTPTATPLPTPTPSPSATPTPSVSPTASPSSTPVPTATPASSPTQHIWIAVRTDGLPGSGTQTDPFDGSTPQKFDAVMFNYYWTYNLGVHLSGSGPFRTYVNHQWAARPGWVISGDGMYATTLQMTGNIAGMHNPLTCISSDPNIATDNVTIRDLTIDCNWDELSTTADTGTGGEKNAKTEAIMLWGSNNLIDHVRSINSYGSWANRGEQFAIALGAPYNSDGTNNVIQFCRAEQPHGNYGNPFSLTGWAPYVIANSKVLSCTGVGVNSGTHAGFTSGGVNFGGVKNCVIDSNTFIDCYGVAYSDTGSCDGLQITNNVVTRGWNAVGLGSPTLPKQNITISGNSFSIQNRNLGANGGITIAEVPVTNLTISNNSILTDTSGLGWLSFWGVTAQSVNNATITDNIVDAVFYNGVTGTGLTFSNNRHPDGTPVSGL
jgi:hypothetical protein